MENWTHKKNKLTKSPNCSHNTFFLLIDSSDDQDDSDADYSPPALGTKKGVVDVEESEGHGQLPSNLWWGARNSPFQ